MTTAEDTILDLPVVCLRYPLHAVVGAGFLASRLIFIRVCVFNIHDISEHSFGADCAKLYRKYAICGARRRRPSVDLEVGCLRHLLLRWVQVFPRSLFFTRFTDVIVLSTHNLF